jgi:sigma-54 dependent transcriptional regulator, acetoin dehydrogenase operon transcriptional activator AcoR
VVDPSTITSVSLGRGADDDGAGEHAQLILLAGCDEPRIGSSSHDLDEVDEVRFGRGERGARRELVSGRRILRLSVPDGRMSSDHGRLVRGPGGWVLDDPGSKNGAIVDGVLSRRMVLEDGNLVELGRTFLLFRRIHGVQPPAHLRGDVDVRALPPRPSGLATFSATLAHTFDALARVAATTVSVVLLGETGTGKEVVAHALHDLSGRSGPFVPVNCGALPETLIESELFGHRRGAFSGAVNDRPGLIRSADRGTLFLDEIGELPAGSQTAFLRVLQEQEVVPVGDDKPIKVDLRLCAATLRDLEELVDVGGFRADLYARIFGLVVTLPPLRDRREDLGILLAALLDRTPGGDQVRFSPSALRALLRHDWPRNIRELEKVLASAVGLSVDGMIDLDHLPASVRTSRRAPGEAVAATPPRELGPADRELRDQLVALFTVHHGNVVAVSEALGKKRAQIYKWVKRLGIDIDGFRR